MKTFNTNNNHFILILVFQEREAQVRQAQVGAGEFRVQPCKVCGDTTDCGNPLTGPCLRDPLCDVHARWARLKVDCGCGVVGLCHIICLCEAHRLRNVLLVQQQTSWINDMTEACDRRPMRIPPHRVCANIENLSRDAHGVYTCLTRALRAHDLPVYCAADVPL